MDKPVLTDADRALLAKVGQRLSQIEGLLERSRAAALNEVRECLKDVAADLDQDEQDGRSAFVKLLEQKGFQKILDKLATVQMSAPIGRPPVFHPSAPSTSGVQVVSTRAQTHEIRGARIGDSRCSSAD